MKNDLFRHAVLVHKRRLSVALTLAVTVVYVGFAGANPARQRDTIS